MAPVWLLRGRIPYDLDYVDIHKIVNRQPIGKHKRKILNKLLVLVDEIEVFFFFSLQFVLTKHTPRKSSTRL